VAPDPVRIDFALIRQRFASRMEPASPQAQDHPPCGVGRRATARQPESGHVLGSSRRGGAPVCNSAKLVAAWSSNSIASSLVFVAVTHVISSATLSAGAGFAASSRTGPIPRWLFRMSQNCAVYAR
jgi:hypothetical protein